MQYLDKNIDELFASAADGYTLKMPNDWDTISNQLDYTKPKEDKAFNFLKAAILLLPITILSILVVELKDPNIVVKENYSFTQKSNFSTINNNISPKEIIAKKVIPLKNMLTPSTIFKDILKQKNPLNSLTTTSFLQKTNNLISSNHEEIKNEPIKNNSTVIATSFNDSNLVKNDTEAKNILQDSTELFIEKATKNKVAITDKINVVPTIAIAAKDKQKSNKKLYFGVQAGLAYNQIKSQNFTKPGYSIGLIIGLPISRKWAIESGILLTQKSYYTVGQYFKDAKGAANMPVNMDIKSLTGNSTLLEVPLILKYNILNKNGNKKLYLNTGIAGYITTKEHNNYFASINGAAPLYVEATYKQNQLQILGALQVGFGYENKVFNKINIRVEPYLQIPLNGIGIGALPVTTMGLRIGFTNNK